MLFDATVSMIPNNKYLFLLQVDQNGMYFTLTTSDEQDVRINMPMPVCILSLDSEL